MHVLENKQNLRSLLRRVVMSRKIQRINILQKLTNTIELPYSMNSKVLIVHSCLKNKEKKKELPRS